MADDIQDMDDLDNEVFSQQDGAGADKSAELPAAEGSSASTDASKPDGEDEVLNVVRDVVDQRTEKEPAAASSASDEAGQQPDDPNPSEQDNENFSDVPFNKHPRFQKLLTERNTYKVDAVRYQNVQNFLDQNGIAPEEAADLLTIGGLIKTNPAEAWRRMQPVVQQVLIAAGEVLPQDLNERVQKGELSRDAAMEVSRLRAHQASTGAQNTFREQQALRQQQTERQQGIHRTVSEWEADRQLKDPNFGAKQPALMREIAFLQQTEGRPDTADGVRAQLKKAYDAVSASFQPVQPSRPQPRAVAPVRGGNVGGNPQPEPKNTLDIIGSVVANRQAR